MPDGTFDEDAAEARRLAWMYRRLVPDPRDRGGTVSIGLPGDHVSLDPIAIDVHGQGYRHEQASCIGCGKTAVLTFQEGGHPPWLCSDCERRAERSGTIVIDDPDVPSPIDSDAPARLHGAPDKPAKSRGKR